MPEGSDRRSLRVLIADDEPLVRAALRAVVEAEPGFEVSAEVGDGLEAIAVIEAERPDLVLLDVQMPGCDGFEVLAALEPDARPVVIFVTAFDQYAIRAFDHHAIDYLLKPFDDDRVGAALSRARAWILGGSGRAEGHDSMLASVEKSRPRRRFIVKRFGRIDVVPLGDVEWIEARGNYVMLHHGGGEALFRGTLTAIAESLDPERFVRVHRSAVVDLDRVESVEPVPAGDAEAVLSSGARIRVGRSYRAEFERRLVDR